MLKGALAATVLAFNTVGIVTCMLPAALLKLALPFAAARSFADRILNALARRWIAVNGCWMALAQPIRWDVRGVEGLNPCGWYLVASNHQSWVDILVLQEVFRERVPLLKFFLKRSLLYVPFLGLAWWALDFPFVRRERGVRASRGDLETIRRACERFRAMPTAVTTFLEGTRFTRGKALAQRSPYRHLLKPKAAGMTMALATLGDKVDAVLDVTIVYPGGSPRLWGLLCGRVDEVIVEVRSLAPPASREPRGVQAWIQDLWSDKDRLIDELLASRAARAPSS